MDSILVQGGISLQGRIRIQGSKNAALPILAACLLTKEQVRLENCPKIADVYGMLRILESLGCHVRWEKDALLIRAEKVDGISMPEDAVCGMRSSIFLLGALLARRGRAELLSPGGCVIGKRPIDMHLNALRRMGVRFEEKDERILACSEGELQGSELDLSFPSVGATENIILAAVMARGVTRLKGAAREPEVQALCEFLIGCGAHIEGAGQSVLRIEGGGLLHGTEYRIPADRIVAGTYLFAGFATGGEIFLEDAPTAQMEASLSIAKRMGATLMEARDGLYVLYPARAGKLPEVKTEVYPGFPTDLQSVLLAVRCTGIGVTRLQETIFENRFRVVDALCSMGARIDRENGSSVVITGVPRLRGNVIEAHELRGGAALVVAALGAYGETIIYGRKFIERGYENICRDFREVGARIVSG